VKRNNGNHQIGRLKYPDIEFVHVPRIHGFDRLVVHIHPPCGLLRFELRPGFDFHRHLGFGISHAKGSGVANPLEINDNGNGVLRLRMSRVGIVDGQYDNPPDGSSFGPALAGRKPRLTARLTVDECEKSFWWCAAGLWQSI
jgi:hypothetical protein